MRYKIVFSRWFHIFFFRFSFRTFFASERNFRNKNDIFNAQERPDIIMEESFRQKVLNNIISSILYWTFFLKIIAGYRHPRSIPIISPSKEFDANVKKIFDKGLSTNSLYSSLIIFYDFFFFSVYISQRDHLSRYLEAGNNLKKFIQHRKGERLRWLNCFSLISLLKFHWNSQKLRPEKAE